ncbi:nicotinate (nicotinamide) nucleotide adenylyltransferase [Rubritalea marina]|uniref:nicotinate (nicotinamide) nucleotide adenylyltransferase n=1 Tax=Rubritalea marina TaxID=361055 RepID=UPI00036C792C|nr:nicotinate (nicotinamide) nucleotide adenylyltransferase [Rubritalea marina]
MQSKQPKLCLYGGTFDPIHLGHTFVAQKIVQSMGIDRMIFLPCRQSPHKERATQFSDAQRLAMCQAATQQLPWAEVSDFDLTAPSPSYSWRTAEHFSNAYPEHQLFWLMGTDQWQSFDRWARADYIQSLLHIIVYNRDSREQKSTSSQSFQVDGIVHQASATQIRMALTKNESSPWIHPSVLPLIKKFATSSHSPLDKSNELRS